MCRARSAARRAHTRAALNACMFSSVMGVALERSTRPRGASLAPSSRLRHVRHARALVFDTFTSVSGTRTRVSDTFRRELRIVEHALACPRYDTRLVANTAAPSCPNQSHSRTLYASFAEARAIFSTSSAKFSTWKCKIQSRRVQGQHTGVAALEEVDGHTNLVWPGECTTG
jgi:hypothetical protein